MKIKLMSILLLLSLLIFPLQSNTQTRDPSRVYKVAILPFMIFSQENLDYLREGIYEILSTRIMVEGRIEVIERNLVEQALYEERPVRLDEAVAQKIGMRVGADYIVLGSITKVGNYISLDARLINITEEKPPLSVYTQHKGIDDVMLKIGDFAQDIGYKILGRRVMTGRLAEPRQPGITYLGKETGYKRSQTFNFEIKGLDIGDVDGDKKNELVLIDNHNIYIFKYDGEKMKLFQKIETGYEHNFLTLDVADVNRNGFAEIIVTSVVEDNLRSFILEYEEGKFRKITEKSNWFFRVLEHPKEGLVLMGQRMSPEAVIEGPIYKFVWKKKSFEKGPKLPFPKESTIFGITFANIRNKDTMDVLVIDEFDRLRLLSLDGKQIWFSRDRFGGTNNSYDTRKKKDIAFRPGAEPPWRVYIPGRILIRDLDGDGQNEVIINKNHRDWRIFDKVRSFDKAEVYNLIWEENALITNWKTRDVEGYFSDFQVKDVDNDGEPELVVSVVNTESMLSRKGTSNVLFFKLF